MDWTGFLTLAAHEQIMTSGRKCVTFELFFDMTTQLKKFLKWKNRLNT